MSTAASHRVFPSANRTRPDASEARVRHRIEAGQTNAVRRTTGRPLANIIVTNVFTWFNLILGILWVLTVVWGSWRDALSGMVLVLNSGIGIVQELRARRTLDRLSLHSASRHLVQPALFSLIAHVRPIQPFSMSVVSAP